MGDTVDLMLKAHGDVTEALNALRDLQAAAERVSSAIGGKTTTGIGNAATGINKMTESAKTGSSVIQSVFGRIQQSASSLGAGVGQLGGFFQHAFEFATGGLIQRGLEGVFSAVGNVAGAMIGGNAEFETYTAQFASLLGSTDAATAKLKDLATFAAVTPFELPEVIQASKTLQTFGGNLLNTQDNLNLVGNAAAVANQPIGEVSFWVGRAYNAIKNGQPFGEAAARLQEMGILGGDARLKLEQLQKTGAKGDQVWAAFTTGLNAPSDAMQKLGQTFSGLMSTMQDTLAGIGRTIGAPLFAAIKNGLGPALAFLSDPSGSFQASVQAFANNLGAGLTSAIDFATGTAIPALQHGFALLQGIFQDFSVGDIGGAFDGIAEGASNLLQALGVPQTAIDAITDGIRTFGQIAQSAFGIAKDAVTTFSQAYAGNWQDSTQILGIHRIVGDIGLAFGAARNAVETFVQAFSGNWQDSSEIDALSRVAGALGLAFRAAVPYIKDAFTSLTSMSAGTGGLNGVMNTLADVLGRIGSALSTVVGFVHDNVAAQATLVAILTGIGTYYAIATAASIAHAIATQGVAAATWVMNAAQTALNVVLTANPIGLIVIALAALAAGLVYAYTHSETFRAAVDAVWASIQSFVAGIGPAFQNFVTFVTGAWTQVTTFTQQAWADFTNYVSTAVNGVVAFLSGIGASVTGAVSGWWTGVVEGATAAWTAITGAVQTAGTILTGVVVFITTFISSLLNQAWSALAPSVMPYWNAIVTVVQAALQVLQAYVQAAIALVVSIIQTGWSALSGIVSGIWNGIVSVVQSAVSAFTGPVQTAASSTSNALTTAWNTIASVTSSVWNTISSTISSVVATITAAVSTGVNTAQTALSAAWTTISSVTSTVWNAISSVISTVMSTILSALTTAVNAMLSAATTAWNSIQSAAVSAFNAVLASVTSVFTQIPGVINNALGGIPGQVLAQVAAVASAGMEVGRNIIQGVINGIGSMVGAIGGALSKAFGDAVAAAKAAMKIGSPSKVTEDEIGKPLMQGVATGVKKGGAAVSKTMTEQLDATIKQTADAVSAAVDALNKLKGYNADNLFEDAIYGFAEDVSRVITALLESSKAFSGKGLEAAAAFGEAASKAVGWIKTGVDALTSLQTYNPDRLYEDAVYGIAEDAARVVTAIEVSAKAFNKDGLEQASLFSENAQKILGLLEPAIKAVAAIGKLGAVKNVEDVAGWDTLLDNIEIITFDLTEMASNFKTDALTQAGVFSDAAGKVMGLVSSAIDVVGKIHDIKDIQNVDDMTVWNTLADDIESITFALTEMASTFHKDGLDQAAIFSDAATKIMGLVSTSVDAISKLSEISGIPAQSFGALATDIRTAVDWMVRLADEFDVTGVDAAVVFADAVEHIIAPIKNAVDAFTSLKEYEHVPDTRMSTLAADLYGAVYWMQQIAGSLNGPGLVAAATFADAANKILAPIKTALDAFKSLNEYKGIAPKAILQFQSDFYGVLGMLQGLLTTAQTGATTAASFANSLTTIASAIQAGVSAFSALSDAGLNIGDFIAGAFTVTQDTFTEGGAQTATLFLQAILDGMMAGLEFFAGGIREFLADTADVGITPFLNVMQDAFDLAGRFWVGALNSSLTNGAQSVKDATNTGVIQPIITTFQAATQGGSGLMSAAKAVGSAIDSGIKAGIDAGIPGLEEAARHAAEAAVAAARAALSISSPSRVTAEEIGLPFMAGIAQGITGGQGDTLNAIFDVLTNITGLATGYLTEALMGGTAFADMSQWLPQALNTWIGSWQEADWQEFGKLTKFVQDGMTALVQIGRVSAAQASSIVYGTASQPGVANLLDDLINQIALTGTINQDGLRQIQQMLGDAGAGVFAQLQDQLQVFSFTKQIGDVQDALRALDSGAAKAARDAALEPLRQAVDDAKNAASLAKEQVQQAKDALDRSKALLQDARSAQELRAAQEQIAAAQEAVRQAEANERARAAAVDAANNNLKDAQQAQTAELEKQKQFLQDQLDLLKQQQTAVQDHLAGLQAVDDFYSQQADWLKQIADIETRRNDPTNTPDAPVPVTFEPTAASWEPMTTALTDAAGSITTAFQNVANSLGGILDGITANNGLDASRTDLASLARAITQEANKSPFQQMMTAAGTGAFSTGAGAGITPGNFTYAPNISVAGANWQEIEPQMMGLLAQEREMFFQELMAHMGGQ
jgi:phage-related protein